MWRHRYLIDIEGGNGQPTGFSARLMFLVHTRRLLFIAEREFYDWTLNLMEPWVHYVHVKRDLSDLYEKIKWADDHPEEVSAMIEAMTSVAPTRQTALHAFHDIIQSLATPAQNSVVFHRRSTHPYSSHTKRDGVHEDSVRSGAGDAGAAGQGGRGLRVGLRGDGAAVLWRRRRHRGFPGVHRLEPAAEEGSGEATCEEVQGRCGRRYRWTAVHREDDEGRAV